MRGADEQPGSMFSYVSLEERVPADHPLRAIRRITDRALARLSPQFGQAVYQFRAAVDPAGEAVARVAAAGALHDPQRAAADGAAGLQPAVSLVRGPGHGRRRVVADDVHARIATACSTATSRAAFFEAVLIARRHASAAVGRALHRGRDVAGGVGESEELPAAGSRSRRRAAAAIRPSNFHGAAPDAMRRISRRRIPTRGCTRRPAAARRGSATWGMC